jgi:hypothetical protein
MQIPPLQSARRSSSAIKLVILGTVTAGALGGSYYIASQSTDPTTAGRSAWWGGYHGSYVRGFSGGGFSRGGSFGGHSSGTSRGGFGSTGHSVGS